MIKASALVQDLYVPGLILEQRFQSKDGDLGIVAGDRGVFQKEVGLWVIRIGLKDLFYQLDGLARILLQFALRFHDRKWRGRKLEEALLFVLCPRDFGAPQHLPAGEELRFLLQEVL